jgi:uncharacterized protein (DUF433 family)
VAGTRISVEVILEWIASGATPEAIHEAYPHVPLEGVRQAVLYAARFLENEVVVALPQEA